MATKDLHSQIQKVIALNVQTIATDTTTDGNIIDMQGYNSIEFVYFSGAYTDGTYSPIITEGSLSNLSDGTSVGDADVLVESTITIAAANTIRKLGYRGTKRYLRFRLSSASTTSGAVLGCVAILSNATNAPIA